MACEPDRAVGPRIFRLAGMRGPAAYGEGGPMGTRVLIVDDSEAYAHAASALLEDEGLSIVGTAGTTHEALELSDRLEPDVVLVDVGLGAESGFDAARLLARAGGPAIVMVSTRELDEVAAELGESPAAGFVAKAELSASAIRAVIAPGG